jgi:Cu(I)/Ag(I) efflux system outer membrane protein
LTTLGALVCFYPGAIMTFNRVYAGTFRLVIALFFLMIGLSACSLAPEYQRPPLPVPQRLGDDVDAPTDGRLKLPSYKEFLPEPRLRELIAIALTENRDLRLASLRIDEALAQYGVTRSEQFPMLEAMASDSVQGASDKSTSSDYEVGLSIPAFELDFFGRVRNMTQAALDEYLATAHSERYARIAIVSSVAGAYLDTRLAWERKKLTERNLQNFKASMAFVEERILSGQSSLLDLERARGLVEFAYSELAGRKAEIVRAENALNILLGNFDPKELSEPLALLKWPTLELPSGLSSTNLLNRPDILEAEHQLMGANADIGVARAAFFPTISLTGILGFMSMELSSLFSTDTDQWSFTPKLTLPLFSGGRNRQNLALAEIRKEMAVVNYEKAIQGAFKEVLEALSVRADIAERFSHQQRYLATQRRVLELASNRYQSGVISYLEVLEAQRDVYDAEMTLLEIKREQVFNDISLYTALGGGFEEDLPIGHASED